MKRLLTILLCSLMAICGLDAHAVQQLIKSGATEPIPVWVTDASGNPVTGVGAGSFTLTVRKPNTGAYIAALGSIAESGNGEYDYTPTSAETTIQAAKNILLVHAVVTATPTSFGDSAVQIVAFDPASSTNLGLSALPTGPPAASGGLITVGTGAGQLSPNGSGGLTAVTTLATGTAQAGSTSTTIVLAAGTGATFSTADQIKGDYVLITGGTGIGQPRTITGWTVGSNTAAISRPWLVTPDNTSTYVVIGNPHPALDSNLAITVGNYSSLEDPATFVWGATAASYVGAGTMGAKANAIGTDTPGTGTLITRIGAPAGASIAADIAAIPAASATSTWAAVSRTLTGVVTLGPNEDTALTRLFGTLNATPAFTAASMALFPNVTVGGYATGMAPKDVLNLAIPNEGGLTLGQAVYGSFLQTMGKFGAPTRAVSSPWTISVPFIRASDGLTVFTYTTTYTDSTFSKTLSRSYTTSSLPTF